MFKTDRTVAAPIDVRGKVIHDPAMFEDPLYLVNYLYAGLFATKAYAMIKEDAPGFRQRYLAYLKEGFDAPPDALLRRLFGREVSVEQLVGDDMGLFKAKVAELSSLYESSTAR